MDSQTIMNILNFAVFTLLGFLVASRIKMPKRGVIWPLLLALLVIAPTIGVSTRLIDIFGFVFFFNYALQGLLFGILARWLWR
jgi:hypothetical protein